MNTALPRKRSTCRKLACVAGPQFYGGPDLQRAGKILPAANQAPHKIEGLPRRLVESIKLRYALTYKNGVITKNYFVS